MREQQQHTFSTHDGVELFYRHWPATTEAGSEPRQAILLFHRGHEHSGRIAHLVDELDLPHFDFFAWDARGHGQSPGERGDSPSFATSARDVQTFCDHIGATYGIEPANLAVIAQSVGAVIAATWVHDYAPNIRALVLASPAFKVKLYVPFARPGLALMRRFRGNFFVNSYVKAKFLSHDPERVASYDSDPLITKAISVNVLLGLYEAADRVVADAQAIQVPTQLLISGSDFVVHRKPQQQFFERLGSLKKNCTSSPVFSTTPSANVTAPWHWPAPGVLSCKTSSTRWTAPACWMPTRSARPAPNPNPSPRRCHATHCVTCTGA